MSGPLLFPQISGHVHLEVRTSKIQSIDLAPDPDAVTVVICLQVGAAYNESQHACSYELYPR